MLKVAQLSVDYGDTRVVSDIDVQLADDEILMLVGPTGCGKTTILNALAGLVPISQGSIELPGWTATPARRVPPEQRHVGMVFQDFALFPHLTVEENVCFRLDSHAPADHWLELLGLGNFRHARPGQLSGGQKQRVALARALAHEPTMMLLDEPLSNLDAALKDSLRWQIRDALKDAGVPAVWVTHDQDEALSIGDRLGVLRDGRIVQLDTPEACFSRPANRFVATFLGEASFISGQLNNGVAETVLGPLQTTANQAVSGHAEIMLRPDDCHVSPVDAGGNGSVTTARYEGETWLYSVRLDDDSMLRIRTNHEHRIEQNTRVSVQAVSTQPLAAFTD